MKAVASALRIARKADGGRASSPNFVQANADMQLTPQEQALYQRHLTNLTGSGGVDNPPDAEHPQGSRSTLYQSVEQHGGKYYSVPTVWDGKREVQPFTKSDGTTMDEPNQTALNNVTQAGWDTFPSYATPEQADARYEQMHGYMDKDTGQFLQNRAANTPDGSGPPMRKGGMVARAIHIARKAGGGAVAPFAGYIHGDTGGRTDNKPIDVEEGSYVIPADILSGLGEGNSHAGWAALQSQFGMDQPPMKADGGAIGAAVPIVAASGEGVVPPKVVEQIGGGDVTRGHSILDALVSHVRKKTIKTLSKLPKPKKN